jgi:hypothetical protein
MPAFWVEHDITYRYAICYFGRDASRPRATTAVAGIDVRIDPEVEDSWDDGGKLILSNP